MKITCAILLLAITVTTAHADEISIKLSDQDQTNIVALPVALDQCIAGVTLRADYAVCRLIGQALNGLSQAVLAAKPKPSPPVSPPQPKE